MTLNTPNLPPGLDTLTAVQASIARITNTTPPGTSRAETICRLSACPPNSP